MRPIKFRGKRLDNAKWVYGYLADGYYINDINAPARTVIEVDSHTVGQFTGLLDRNGKEIYEGDILEHNFDNGNVSLSIVGFRGGRFVAIDPLRPYRDETVLAFIDYAAVVGNVYDNPELVGNEQSKS